MFDQYISTVLSTKGADKLFPNINRADYLDQSFTATLRALLYNRLQQNEETELRLIAVACNCTDASLSSPRRFMSSYLKKITRQPDENKYNIFIIHALAVDSGKRVLDIARDNFGEGHGYYGDYALQESLQAFYARKVNALFYMDPTNHNTVIFVEQLNLKSFHALQMMIPKYLSPLFSRSPLTDKEILLLKSTGHETADEYERLLSEFIYSTHMRNEIIRQSLEGFETVIERMLSEEARDAIANFQCAYNSHLNAMQDLAIKMREKQYILAGLECAITSRSENSEITDYFLCNKNLNIMGVHDTAIEFMVHSYADIYDADAFEQYVSNHDGYMYDAINPTVSASQMEALYRAIFETSKYKLRMCAAYTADIKGSLVGLQQYFFRPTPGTHLPNPHIQHYGCIGDYGRCYVEYIHKKDYVGAFEQAAASARNLNFCDSTVMSIFAEELSTTEIKCIEKSDGTLITPLEAIDELNNDYD